LQQKINLMAGKIPQPFIDQVLNQTDIVDLIGGYIELKQKGKEHTACCPFHHEKTPSFTVSADKQFYHCFGCGAHGTVVGFLMEYEGLQFVEAIETLANRLGIEVPREATNNAYVDNHTPLYNALSQANDFFTAQLRTHQPAIDYLKHRGITGTIAAEFDIGYAPNGYDNLRNHLANRCSEDDLIRAGLVSKKDGAKGYDRFRDRIMFPIKDTRGRVIGFGARIINQGEPKYLNSPETPLFHKSNTLYGLYECRKKIKRLDKLLIVEGYMDVVALAQHGVHNCVATLGTATTSTHIKTLLRYCSDLVFCFDGDRAGKDAAWHALEQVLIEFKDGIDVRFAFMPSGDDPDTLIRQLGKDGFDQYIFDAMPLSEFLFNKFSREIDLSSLDGRAKLAEAVKPLLAKIPKTVFRDLLTKELNSRVGTTVESTRSLPNQTRPPSQSRTSKNPKYTKIRLAITLLLRDPQLASEALAIEDLHYLEALPGMPLLIKLLQIMESQPDLKSISLLERFREQDDYIHLQKLLDWDPPDLANRQQSFIDVMKRFQADIQRIKLGAIIENQAPTDGF
jgi:DNA primase